MRAYPKARPLKGLLAGAVAGLGAAYVMGRFHDLFQSAGPSAGFEEDSTVKAAAAISQVVFRHELTRSEKKVAGPVMHYGFGATLAGIYGVAAELHPELRTGWGVPFGMAVWLSAHVIAVPALGWSRAITTSPRRAEAVEFGAHLVFGAVAESLRSLVRMGGLRSQRAQ